MTFIIQAFLIFKISLIGGKNKKRLSGKLFFITEKNIFYCKPVRRVKDQ
jgi:hypothetical protein